MHRFLLILCLLPVPLSAQAQVLPADKLLPDNLGPANHPLPPSNNLPEAPSFLLAQSQQPDQPAANPKPAKPGPAPCPSTHDADGNPIPTTMVRGVHAPPCLENQSFYKRFSNYPGTTPMTSAQKGYLAVHDIIDPFNILTILGTSAFTIGIDSHTAYGPGLRGFGVNAGLSFVQDATGEVIGTYAIASLAHEDPRYHRMPNARPMRRVLHAFSHTIIAHHDDGRSMPNYETLLIYPISAELANLYIPGIADDAKSTSARIGIGLISNPADDLIAEFLPDFAAHVHIHVVVVQRILNQIATGQSGSISIGQ